jgi:hypothetical protein
MIRTPIKPTEKYIRGRVSFHEDQARWFGEHGQTSLEVWARSVADEWREKLPAKTKGANPNELPSVH